MVRLLVGLSLMKSATVGFGDAFFVPTGTDKEVFEIWVGLRSQYVPLLEAGTVLAH